ncbi:phosphodiester glycosidase family protein [Serratia sp. M24T3]|uniref:phosphodiester glycosidase family protein n=1 Tax=Serratia sp. M24T3 TaxID=932213 RepID=UPI00025B9B77|nr:phosphodiester glycosidase family protein [Serratia sp. M24T3]EIC85956.1 YD repeat-containing protein [Serratia sp. M24T3]
MLEITSNQQYMNISLTNNPQNAKVRIDTLLENIQLVANSLMIPTMESKSSINEMPEKITAEKIKGTLERIMKHVFLSSSLEEDKLNLFKIIKIQSLFRGKSLRKQITVKSLGKGVTLVEINGYSCLSKISGVKNISKNTDSDNKIVYVAINQRYFRGRVRSSDAVSQHAKNCSDSDIYGTSSKVQSVFINGGYYNFLQRSSSKHAEMTPIGRMVVDGLEKNSITPPEEYKEDYIEMIFSDNSILTSAPALSKNGIANSINIKEEKYHLGDDFSFITNHIKPGELKHAADRNPRAAISYPENFTDGIVRMAICLSENRKGGCNLHEWGQFMMKLDRMNNKPNSSINLDGGHSAQIVILLLNEEYMLFSQSAELTSVGNYIEYARHEI